MTVEWNAIATITAPILGVLAGVWGNRKFENRPHLISYFGHISAFRSTPPQGQPMLVHTHSAILRNTGRRSATNVRLHHAVLPEFNVWPSIPYRVEDLPDGRRDIVLPALVPGEEVTISYLYFPPLTAAGVNAGIKYDEGFAQAIPVLLQRQRPLWLTRLMGVVLLVGTISCIYLAYLGFRRLIP